jgi:hypothetical protein
MHSKFKFIFLAFTLLVLFTSCEKDPGTLQVNFQAMYGEEPIVLLDDYVYHDGSTIEFTKLDFYISDVSLIRNDDTELVLTDIEFVNLTAGHEDAGDAADGYPIRFNDLEAANFKTLRFNIGVPQDLNSKEPGEFESSHPLARSSHYWTPWTSYIFAKTEGRIDTLGDGIPDLGFLQHSGKDELLRSFTVDVPIAIEGEKTTEITIAIDYEKLYGSAAEYLDIKSKPLAHNPGDLSFPTTMADNYVNAIYVKQ